MTAYEQQILNTERFYDRAILAAEQEDQEILSSGVLSTLIVWWV